MSHKSMLNDRLEFEGWATKYSDNFHIYMLRPAQYSDGSLKDASQLNWRHLASPPDCLIDIRSCKKVVYKEQLQIHKKINMLVCISNFDPK